MIWRIKGIGAGESITMLLTLTTTHPPATDLGFLLHKHPDRVQAFSLPFGAAHVFYSEARSERCTAVLLLDIDPVALVRGRPGARPGAEPMQQYVNDRPYAASSFLSVAMRRVFGTAMTGRCEGRPELADRPLPLAARIVPLRGRGGIEIIRMLFEPLGHTVTAVPAGETGYWDVTLAVETTLSRLLTHLYVLIPVLDDQKHYWIGEDEIDKLLRHGEGWLNDHPARDLIARRYLKHQQGLTNRALARLDLADDALPEDEPQDAVREEQTEPTRRRRLNDERLECVVAELKQAGASSVLDLGCGSGRLLRLLARERQFVRIVGVDACSRDLEGAARRLRLDRATEAQRERIRLLHGALTYRDSRLRGFDAAAAVEVIEHIDPPRLGAFADAVFGTARPRTLVLTTPNAEFNARYPALEEGASRHPDHRFEWSRAEFRAWAETVAGQYDYDVRVGEIGEVDPELGAPSHLGVFRCR